MPSPGQSALKFLRSNLRRGAKPKVRIAVLGQASVGKTALIVRYVTNRFIYDYAPEIAKVYQHQTVLDQEEVNMEIWDTAGHFNSSAELRHLEVFIRWADVVVLVYSITDRASFNLVRQLMEQISQIRPRQQLIQQLSNEETKLDGASPTADSAGGLLPRPKEIPLLERNNSAPNTSKESLKNGFEFCDHCPDFPVLLVGTKCDLWRDRQIRVECGMQMCHQFGCANFKEISTKENLEEVGDVFELALRQGWLYRQHRELTKHRTLTLYTSSSSPAFEKSNSFDNSSFDWLENQTGNLMPPSPNSFFGNLSPTSSSTASSNTNPFGLGGESRKLNLTASSTSAGSDGGRKKSSPITPSSFKCQALFSNIKKCITPGGRPMFHSLPSQNYLAPPPPGLGLMGAVTDVDGAIIEEQTNNTQPKRVFRTRANTDSRLCSPRIRSLSMGANCPNAQFTIGNESIENKDDCFKPRRKTSVFFP